MYGSLYIVTPADVKDKYSPTEQELLEYYQRHRESFKKPETKIVRLWREKDKEKALNIYRELKAGNNPEGFQEFKLPDDDGKIERELKAELQRLSLQEKVSITKRGEEYVVLYLKEVLPAGYESFEKVKEKVKERLIEEKASSIAFERAKEVAQSLKEGKKPQAKALNFSDTPVAQLSAVVNIQGRDLTNLLLSEEKVFGPYPLRQGYGVLLIERRSKKNISKEEREEVLKDILSLKSQALLNQYIESMKKNTKIRINRELLGGE